MGMWSEHSRTMAWPIWTMSKQLHLQTAWLRPRRKSLQRGKERGRGWLQDLPISFGKTIREISAIVLCVGRNKYFTVMSPVELEEEKRQTWTWVGDPFCLFFLICRLSFISNTEWPKTRGLRSTNVPCVLPIPFLLACPESPKDSCLGLSSLAGVGRWKECQKQPDQVPCGCPAQWAHSAAPGAGLWDANLWHIRYPGSPQGAH